MSGKLRLPNITASDTDGQVQQIKSYLFQLIPDLNFALGTASGVLNASAQPGTGSSSDLDATKVFAVVKELIIKSSDIVNAYYDKLSQRFDIRYVGLSYTDENSPNYTHKLEPTAEKMEHVFTNATAAADSYVKSGFLTSDTDGAAVYGIEVGEKTKVDGVDVFQRYARFLPNRLRFYDSSGTELAYFSNSKLSIPTITATLSFQQGNLVRDVQANGSVVAHKEGDSSTVFIHEDASFGSFGFGKRVEEADVFDFAEDKTVLIRGGLQVMGQGYLYLLNLMHPVGSMLETAENTNPGNALGGTWVLFEDTGSTYKWQRTQ